MLGDLDSSNHVWTDDSVDLHVSHALNELSRHAPLERSGRIGSFVGRVANIEGVAAGHITLGALRQTGVYPYVDLPYSVWNNQLTLESEDGPETGATYDLFFTVVHTLETLPVQYEDLVMHGASAFAAYEAMSRTSNAVNVGGFRASDTYRELGAALLAQFNDTLQRLFPAAVAVTPEAAPLVEPSDAGPRPLGTGQLVIGERT